jgi:hypothetical protein
MLTLYSYPPLFGWLQVRVLPGPREIKGLCVFRILTVRLPHQKHRILVATAIKLPLQKPAPMLRIL